MCIGSARPTAYDDADVVLDRVWVLRQVEIRGVGGERIRVAASDEAFVAGPVHRGARREGVEEAHVARRECLADGLLWKIVAQVDAQLEPRLDESLRRDDDAHDGAIIFNRAVTLRDTWAKIEKAACGSGPMGGWRSVTKGALPRQKRLTSKARRLRFERLSRATSI